MLGSGSAAVSKTAAAGIGDELLLGAGGAQMSVQASGQGLEAFTGVGSSSVQPVGVSGQGAESMVGTGAAAVAPLEAAGLGDESIVGSGQVTLLLACAGMGQLDIFCAGTAAVSPLSCIGFESLVETTTFNYAVPWPTAPTIVPSAFCSTAALPDASCQDVIEEAPKPLTSFALGWAVQLVRTPATNITGSSTPRAYPRLFAVPVNQTAATVNTLAQTSLSWV